MAINLEFNGLIAVALLSSFTVAGTEENTEANDIFAPEATAADATFSFWDIPYLERAFIDAAPTDREDELVVGELGVDGGGVLQDSCRINYAALFSFSLVA